jgi:hypothetical protein
MEILFLAFFRILGRGLGCSFIIRGLLRRVILNGVRRRSRWMWWRRVRDRVIGIFFICTIRILDHVRGRYRAIVRVRGYFYGRIILNFWVSFMGGLCLWGFEGYFFGTFIIMSMYCLMKIRMNFICLFVYFF